MEKAKGDILIALGLFGGFVLIVGYFYPALGVHLVVTLEVVIRTLINILFNALAGAVPLIWTALLRTFYGLFRDLYPVIEQNLGGIVLFGIFAGVIFSRSGKGGHAKKDSHGGGHGKKDSHGHGKDHGHKPAAKPAAKKKDDHGHGGGHGPAHH